MKKLLLALTLVLGCLKASNAQIVITEIMYNPAESGTDTTEFIELYNAGTTTENLQNYYFSSGIVDTFLNSTPIAAGSYVVITVNSAAFQNRYGIAATKQWISGGLNNTGEAIVLRNASGVVVDSVFYRDSAPFPTGSTAGQPDEGGASLVLCDPNSDNNIGSNWRSSTTVVGGGLIINTKPVSSSPFVSETACLPPTPVNYPLYPIGTVNTSSVTGVADSLNVTCEVRGVVHSIDFDGNAGYDMVLIDYLHNGITVFSATDKNLYTAPALGDSIHVLGRVGQFNGLTQFLVDSIVLAQTGSSLLAPINLTSPINESNENKLVRISSVTLVDPLQWTGTGSGFNVNVTNGAANWTLRIDNDCVWYGLAAPTGTLDIIGTVSQFDVASPYDSGYQIRPRILSDISTQSVIPSVFFAPNSLTVNEDAGTVTLDVNIFNPNSNPTSVDLVVNAASTASASDYSGLITPVTITFPANSSAVQQVSFNIIDDALIENSESLVLELTNVTNAATLGADSLFTLTINDNDVAPTPVYNLVITEIMYNNPLADSVEFIEIYNNDTATVDLAGYQVSNAVFYTFPTYSLAPGARVVVCQDSVLFQQRFAVSAFRWNTGNSLNNTTEGVVLKNNLGVVLDSVQYANTAPWPTQGSGNGPSIQLCDVNSDNNIGSNWGASSNLTGVFIGGVQIKATPGAANTFCRPPYSVASIGNIDNTNSSGSPDSLGLDFEIRGVVHCGDFRVGAGLDFYLINYLNEGIKIFSSSDRGYNVTEGDSLHIWGIVSQGNGVTEFLVDSIFFINSGNATVSPTVITSALTENNEGSFIRINNVSLTNATQWTGAGTGFNVDITNGSTTWQLRIDDAVDLFSQPAPSGSFNVYGIGNQFDPSAPYTTGYQLLACSSAITAVGTETLERLNVNIFPNPVNEELNISADMIEALYISNMLGQEIIRLENVNTNFKTVSTAQLAPGVYNVIVTNNGKRTAKQFVKS
jgi:hypothetical protein